MTNVVDMLEFGRRKQPPMSINQRLDELETLIENHKEAELAQLRATLRWERQLRRKYEAELMRIDRARFPVADAEVLRALRHVSSTSPVRARLVAELLFPADCPNHSAVIRVGFALGRLERAGRAQRVSRRGHEAWAERNGYEWQAGYGWQAVSG